MRPTNPPLNLKKTKKVPSRFKNKGKNRMQQSSKSKFVRRFSTRTISTRSCRLRKPHLKTKSKRLTKSRCWQSTLTKIKILKPTRLLKSCNPLSKFCLTLKKESVMTLLRSPTPKNKTPSKRRIRFRSKSSKSHPTILLNKDRNLNVRRKM